jgi:hypothetical protein
MVKAAETQSPAGAAAVLRRLRLAWFLKARPIDDRDELLAWPPSSRESTSPALAPISPVR